MTNKKINDLIDKIVIFINNELSYDEINNNELIQLFIEKLNIPRCPICHDKYMLFLSKTYIPDCDCDITGTK